MWIMFKWCMKNKTHGSDLIKMHKIKKIKKKKGQKCLTLGFRRKPLNLWPRIRQKKKFEWEEIERWIEENDKE